MLLVPLLAVGFAPQSRAAGRAPKQLLREAIPEARGHTGYIFFATGSIVYGFHLTFVATHFSDGGN